MKQSISGSRHCDNAPSESSDLKAWDDVAPGQFLGSDTARPFRIQTTEAK